ncbi:MAG: dcd [Dehalococcoidia bacterium]|nr:dcd [Dehalococcoidia bacterium]
MMAPTRTKGIGATGANATDRKGVFPVQWLKHAVEKGWIWTEKPDIPQGNFQPASLDLRLAQRAYRLRASFLPDTDSVEKKLDDLSMGVVDLTDGGILERNRPYLIPLMEHLRLPGHIKAKTNPRSSTGRLDIFTRVITDCSNKFDEIRPGYNGRLYLEVLPRTFTIKVRAGLSLNQIRLVRETSRCTDDDLRRAHQDSPILFVQEVPVPTESLALNDGLFLGVDLAGDTKRPVAYRAKKNSQLLDLSLLDAYDLDDFWEPVHAEPKQRIVLEPEEFYLILSAECVRIPPQFAAEMAAYDPTSGELRTHYAGFFDPGFGHGGSLKGTKAVLEVRAHDVPFILEHGQKVCKLQFEHMCAVPEKLYGKDVGSSYHAQTKTLSKHFRQKDNGQGILFRL